MSNIKKQFTVEFFQEAGRKGGISTAKRGRDFYKKIGALGAKTRWGENKSSVNNPVTLVVSPEDDPLTRATKS
jgi:hypothetical protein